MKRIDSEKKTKNPQKAGSKKPRIDPPIYIKSPVKIKKVTMRGKRKKPSYMSDDEGDLGEQSDAPAEQKGAPAGGEELLGGDVEDTSMRS